MEHNEKSAISVTTVIGFLAVWEDIDWTLAQIASNTRLVIFSGSLQAVIKNNLLFPSVCRMSCAFNYRIMTKILACTAEKSDPGAKVIPKPKGGFPVMAKTTRNHIFSKEINQVPIAAMVLAPNFY